MKHKLKLNNRVLPIGKIVRLHWPCSLITTGGTTEICGIIDNLVDEENKIYSIRIFKHFKDSNYYDMTKLSKHYTRAQDYDIEDTLNRVNNVITWKDIKYPGIIIIDDPMSEFSLNGPSLICNMLSRYINNNATTD